jgi:hypothetical protein
VLRRFFALRGWVCYWGAVRRGRPGRHGGGRYQRLEMGVHIYDGGRGTGVGSGEYTFVSSTNIVLCSRSMLRRWSMCARDFWLGFS